MAQKVLTTGNEAVGWGAIYAGCRFFFGYPITPQNAIPEFMSRELPKVGGTFIQAECENAAINMVFGASAAGARAITTTSSPGIALMGEGISGLSAAQLPAVVVDVVRLGPGWGTIQSGQTDYMLVTKGGGHGGYKCISLAPCSPAETFEMVQRAFYLADKYRIVVIVVSDFIVGEMAAPVELRAIDFGPLPPKDWALVGKGRKGGRRDHHSTVCYMPGRTPEALAGGVVAYHQFQNQKYEKIKETEVRYETYRAEDAELLLVTYGSTARMARAAVNLAREEGLRAGLFRLITLWPFPEMALREAALKAGKVLVVEDSQGQLVEDVRSCVQGRVPVQILGIWGRHRPGAEGIIYPERVFQEVRSLV